MQREYPGDHPCVVPETMELLTLLTLERHRPLTPALFSQQKESYVYHESKRMQPMFFLDIPDDVPQCKDLSMNS